MNRFRVTSAIMAFVLATLACSFNVSSASIKDAWTARDQAGDQRTTTFEQNETFYVKVDLANAPDDTKVKAAFTAVDVEGEEDNKFIGEKELTTGSGMLTFDSSNAKLWPVGKYKAEIFLNGESARTLEFEVKGSTIAQPTVPPPPTSAPQPTQALSTPTGQTTGQGTAKITKAFLARDQDGKQPANRFVPTESVYTIVTLDSNKSVQLKAEWIAKNAQGHAPKAKIDEYSFSADGSGQYYFGYIPPSDQPWGTGQYEVEIYMNEVSVMKLGFTIEAAGAAPAGAGITNAFTAFDEDGNSPTTVFGQQDVVFLIVSFDLPSGATLRAEWYAVDTQDIEDNTLLDSVDSDVTGIGTTWFSFTPNGQWSIGTYRVDLFVDGQYTLSVDFEVQ